MGGCADTFLRLCAPGARGWVGPALHSVTGRPPLPHDRMTQCSAHQCLRGACQECRMCGRGRPTCPPPKHASDANHGPRRLCTARMTATQDVTSRYSMTHQLARPKAQHRVVLDVAIDKVHRGCPAVYAGNVPSHRLTAGRRASASRSSDECAATAPPSRTHFLEAMTVRFSPPPLQRTTSLGPLRTSG